MKVAEVILAQQGQGPGGLHLSIREGGAVEFGPLDDPDPGEPCDARGVRVLPRRHDDRHLFAVTRGEFLDDAECERVISANDQMIAVMVEAPGNRGHCAI